VDMGNVHNQLKGFIEDGESHSNWPELSPPLSLPYLGIKSIDELNEVTVAMPD